MAAPVHYLVGRLKDEIEEEIDVLRREIVDLRAEVKTLRLAPAPTGESTIRAEERDRCAKVCTDEADHLRKALGPGDQAMCVATANTIRSHIRAMADEVKS